jgi:hypothetical protein
VRLAGAVPDLLYTTSALVTVRINQIKRSSPVGGYSVSYRLRQQRLDQSDTVEQARKQKPVAAIDSVNILPQCRDDSLAVQSLGFETAAVEGQVNDTSRVVMLRSEREVFVRVWR